MKAFEVTGQDPELARVPAGNYLASCMIAGKFELFTAPSWEPGGVRCNAGPENRARLRAESWKPIWPVP
jgi:hypothetical protein